MSANYRLKLSKDTIKLKKKGNFTLNKSLDSSEEVRFNFLLNYYGDSLFTKLSRLHIDKLSEILRIRNLDKLIEASKKKDILKAKVIRHEILLFASSKEKMVRLEMYTWITLIGMNLSDLLQNRGSFAICCIKVKYLLIVL